MPALLSLLLLAGLGAATAALALQHEVRPSRPHVLLGAAVALGRDVLTGRRLDARGLPARPTQGWGSSATPLRLRFVPSSDSARSGPAVEALIEFLGRRTGYAIEGKILPNYGVVVQVIVEGQCEVAFLTAASYARAHYATAGNADPADDLTAFLSVVRQGSPEHPGSDLAYRGAIVVRADSDLKDLSQLGAGRTIAMGARTSGAGSILPTATLNALGLAPEIQRYEGYPTLLTALLERAADAACIWWSPPNADNPQNDARILIQPTVPDVFQRTRILAFTGWMPNEPVVARRALPADVRHVLARALCLYVSERARTEAGRRELESIGSLTGLIPATDADFEPVLETIERAFANDPEGRRDFMAASR